MSEQQYRVIADREKGDDVDAAWWQQQAGDRITETVIDAGMTRVDRIERPVPTTELQKPLNTAIQAPEFAGSLPTREQIAEARDAAWQQRWDERVPLVGLLLADEHAGFLAGFDAAVALLQKEADRG